jgi:hypothetical protein
MIALMIASKTPAEVKALDLSGIVHRRSPFVSGKNARKRRRE